MRNRRGEGVLNTTECSEPTREPIQPHPAVLMVAPGGLEHGGGIGRVAGYMLDAWSRESSPPVVRVVDSRGPGHVIFAPAYLARCLGNIVLSARAKPLLHIHVAGRGSTIRKVIVVALARFLKLPIVLHLHDYNYRQSLSELPQVIRLAATSMFQHAHRVLVLTADDRDLLVSSLGVSSKRIQILPNRVPAPHEIAQKSHCDGLCRILFLGDLSQRKGVHDIIAALGTKRLSVLRWHATFVGGGSELADFKVHADKASLFNRMTFTGWVGSTQVIELLQRSQILVLPSYAEGMPMAVLEAMSYGLAIVCTQVGGLSQMIENGISGLFISPGDVSALADALARCIEDEELRIRLGEGARRRFVDNFNAESYPLSLRTAYEAALSDYSRQPRA